MDSYARPAQFSGNDSVREKKDPWPLKIDIECKNFESVSKVTLFFKASGDGSTQGRVLMWLV